MGESENSSFSREKVKGAIQNSIVLYFFVGLFLALGAPYVFAWILNNYASFRFNEDIATISATALTGLVVGSIIRWLFSFNLVNLVDSAIEELSSKLSKDEIDTYKRNAPQASTIFQVRDREYMCLVGKKTIMNEGCSRFFSINDIITLLNHKAFVTGLASFGVNEALNKLKLKHIDENSKTILRTDVSVYLRAWLMVSIKYDCPMQTREIKQRYPTIDNPNHEIYIQAIYAIKTKGIKSGRFRNEVNDISGGYSNADEIINLMDEFLAKLIDDLKKQNN